MIFEVNNDSLSNFYCTDVTVTFIFDSCYSSKLILCLNCLYLIGNFMYNFWQVKSRPIFKDFCCIFCILVFLIFAAFSIILTFVSNLSAIFGIMIVISVVII